MTYALIKRGTDIVGSLVGLLMTALVYVPVAIAIKLDSPGPVIFAQLRVGRDEETFKIYKFRTMVIDADCYGNKPTVDDERVTAVGRWLRRTSLDELPQFYNVLRGEMSLVGPRPEQLPLLVHYRPEEHLRFTVKPGITGWWQVNGRKQPMYEHLDYDVYYVSHRSLRLDLGIILRTLLAVVSGEGAV